MIVYMTDAIFCWNFQKCSLKILFMLALTECVWEFQNNALWDAHCLTILIVLSCLIFQAIVKVLRISRTPHRNTLVNTNMFIVGLSCVNINLPVVSLARDFYQ